MLFEMFGDKISRDVHQGHDVVIFPVFLLTWMSTRGHLKVYVLVTNVHPLTVYLYTDGLARFCTDLYEAPEEENLEMREMHLTNFSINWESDAFEASPSRLGG